MDVKINIPKGIRPIQVLGNAADINGQSVVTRLAQVYSDQQKHVVIEVEIPDTLAVGPSESNEEAKPLQVAAVEVTYTNMATDQSETLSGEVHVTFSSSDEKVKGSRDNAVMADVVALIASEQNKLATQLLDQGDLAACRKTLSENARFLKTNAATLACPSLDRFADVNLLQLEQLEGASSNGAPGAVLSRKAQRDYQLKADQQAPSATKP